MDAGKVIPLTSPFRIFTEVCSQRHAQGDAPSLSLHLAGLLYQFLCSGLSAPAQTSYLHGLAQKWFDRKV
jgi:hypothetical protein